jgi:DNA uptake protein ComE-like DNA-binding protein
MMMVMAMMEVDLHLDSKVSRLAQFVKCVVVNFSRQILVMSEKWAQNDEMRSLLIFAAWSLIWTLASLPASSAASVKAGQNTPAELVDINRASVAELTHVPGMTASWAGRIVRFRPYRTKLDLVQKGVITPEVYARIRDGVIAHRLPTETKP